MLFATDVTKGILALNLYRILYHKYVQMSIVYMHFGYMKVGLI